MKEPSHTAVNINLKGVMNTVKLAIHHMKSQETRGSIVMTASAAGLSERDSVNIILAANQK